MRSVPDPLRFRGRRRPTLELGMTPLIDIVFLLLIFFMLTSRFVLQEGIKVDLPVTRRSHYLPAENAHRITVRSDNTFVVDGVSMTLEELRSNLRSQAPEFLAAPFEILADKGASVQAAISLLEMLRDSGASRVTLGTESAKEQRP